MSGVSERLREAVDWLYSTQLFGVKLGLDGARRLADACGVCLDGGGSRGTKFLHVAGTNGKGSTCAMLAAMCREAGLRTGLYTSPHLVSVRERFEWNGECISEEELLEALNRMRSLVEGWEPHPTFFEIVTVLALRWFQEKGVDVVVLETGLGGRLDATNIVTPAACAIAPVGMDHQQYLGNTLGEIALEKAGIFKPHTCALSSPQHPEVEEVLIRRATEVGCSLEIIKAPWQGAKMGLKGAVQRWNAALATAVLSAARIPVDAQARDRGLANVCWPGRFQEVLPGLILDGAHNPAAAAVLVETWRETFGEERALLVFGSMQDKDTGAVLRELAPIVREVVVVAVDNPRALSVERLTALVREFLPGVGCRAADALAGVLAVSGNGLRLVSGSLFLVGEALAWARGGRAERTVQ